MLSVLRRGSLPVSRRPAFSLNKPPVRRFQSPRYLGNANGNDVILGIVLANGLVFGAWHLSKQNRDLHIFLRKHFILSPYGVFQEKRIHTLVTSFFSHFDPFHFIGNMFVFYSFGQSTLPLLGTARFLSLYFGGGIVSSICQLAWPFFVPKNWPASYENHRFAPGLGASGAVSAVVMYNILTFPREMVYFFGVLPVPAALFGLGFIAMDVYGLYTGGQHGNAAHLGGAVFGAGMFAFMRRRRFR